MGAFTHDPMHSISDNVYMPSCINIRHAESGYDQSIEIHAVSKFEGCIGYRSLCDVNLTGQASDAWYCDCVGHSQSCYVFVNNNNKNGNHFPAHMSRADEMRLTMQMR